MKRDAELTHYTVLLRRVLLGNSDTEAKVTEVHGESLALQRREDVNDYPVLFLSRDKYGFTK